MTKSKKIIIAVAVATLVTLVAILLILTQGKQVSNDTEAELSSENQPVTSMHEGGEEITQEDIDAVEDMTDFATSQAIQYLKDIYPNYRTILVKDTEWYLTDENESYNILVWAEIINKDDTRTDEARVVEMIREGDKLINKQVYKPDSRYSL